MGSERKTASINPGIGFAVEAGHPFIKELLDDYDKSSFKKEDGSLDLTTIVDRTTAFLKAHGLEDKNEIQTVAGITIYPVDYFCPIDMDTGKLVVTENTRSIHRYAASWVDDYSKFRGKVYKIVRRCLGEKLTKKIRSVVGRKGKK